MFHTAHARRGLVVAPHPLAAQAGLAVLREGGDAIEATVAAAAVAAVVCPHVSGLGGDGFWLIHEPGRSPIAIEAAGVAGRQVTAELYRGLGLTESPRRGPLACNTVAGALAGWSSALAVSRGWGGRLPVRRLLDEAICHARDGAPIGAGQAAAIAAEIRDPQADPAFVRLHLPGGKPPRPGTSMAQPALARCLERLAAAGLDDFYRGDVGAAMALDLQAAGSPLIREDLAGHYAQLVEPLAVRLSNATVYGLPPPSQGVAALMILGLFDRLAVPEAESLAHIHGLVEATKHAIRVRDGYLSDPFYMAVEARDFLLPEVLHEVAAVIEANHARPWTRRGDLGRSVWFGAIDAAGRTVSAMQSLCWSFGSGVTLERTGVVWHNQGVGFSLQPNAVNSLISGRKPSHALSPALALFDDGRSMGFGAMGGHNQIQAQTAVFSRYARFGQGLQAAISAPRWILGASSGPGAADLSLENRFAPAVIEGLRQAGHTLDLVEPFAEGMVPVGAMARHITGTLEAAADPRSEAAVAAW
jgi:gamma-glutamyltranspeptidase/glutathione hydrolase